MPAIRSKFLCTSRCASYARVCFTRSSDAHPRWKIIVSLSLQAPFFYIPPGFNLRARCRQSSAPNEFRLHLLLYMSQVQIHCIRNLSQQHITGIKRYICMSSSVHCIFLSQKQHYCIVSFKSSHNLGLEQELRHLHVIFCTLHFPVTKTT